MFFLLALLASLGYSLDSALMASCYRTMDGSSAVAYRGLALAFTMLPLLFFVPIEDFQLTLYYLPWILCASACAAVGNMAIARSFLFLPIGVASALCMSNAALVATAISYLFGGDTLSASQLGLAALVLLTVLALGLSQSTGPLPVHYSVQRGISSSALFGLSLGIAVALVGFASRQIHPFAVGYLWELFIGILAASYAILRGLSGRPGLSRISLPHFFKIGRYSSPTVLGTGCYAFAMTLGPIGVASAIVSSVMVFDTILAALFYGERLTRKQVVLLIAVCAAVASLKFVSVE
jgi:drug/metabolite transporter (DMT)-like permease